MSEPDPVDQVRGTAPDQQAQRDRQDRMARAGAGEENEHPSDRQRSQRGDEPRRVREQAEGDPGVLDVMNRERAEHVHLVVERKLAGDDVLRHLVGEHGRRDDEAEPEPLRPACRQRPRGHRDRRQGIGGGTDPNVDRTRLAQPRLPRASLAHTVAQGRCSSRSGSIGSPQAPQMPYVPSSMRFKAASISRSTLPEFSSSV